MDYLFMKSAKPKIRNHKAYDLITTYVYVYMVSMACLI